MRRIKLIVALIFTLTLFAPNLQCAATPMARKEKTDVENAELIGKVKAVRETYGDESYTATGYDEYGYQTAYNAYFADEGYEDNKTYKNKYDDKGNRIAQDVYNASGSLTYRITYKYDEQGNNTEIVTLDAKGYLNGKSVFVFDDKGNMVEECRYGSSTNIPPFQKHTYTYDSKGNWIEGYSYNNSGKVTTNFTNKYDDRGNAVEKHTDYTSVNESGTINTNATGQTSWLLEYDDKGNETKYTMLDPDGNIISVTTYKLNSYGNIVEQHSIDYIQHTEDKLTYQYKYDEQGNWVEKTCHNAAAVLLEIVKREIEYHR